MCSTPRSSPAARRRHCDAVKKCLQSTAPTSANQLVFAGIMNRQMAKQRDSRARTSGLSFSGWLRKLEVIESAAAEGGRRRPPPHPRRPRPRRSRYPLPLSTPPPPHPLTVVATMTSVSATARQAAHNSRRNHASISSNASTSSRSERDRERERPQANVRARPCCAVRGGLGEFHARYAPCSEGVMPALEDALPAFIGIRSAVYGCSRMIHNDHNARR